MAQRARAQAPAGVEIQVGDITDPRLGLDDRTYERLAGDVVAIHHLAAVYDLAVGAELAERVNVQGTQHVVDFCRRCSRTRAPSLRLDRVRRRACAPARSSRHDLATGQAFKNFYESTKFAAEVSCARPMDEVPTTIYRPAIVVGDSRTGETQKFDGPYYMLRAISARARPARPVRPRRTRRSTSCRSTSSSTRSWPASRTPTHVGHTLHLVDPEPQSSADLFTLLAHEWDGRTPRFRVPPGLLDRSLKFAAVRRAFGGTPRQSIRYLNHPVRFDSAQASEILGRNGLRCPSFTEYVGAIVGFFREHEHDDAYRPPHEK